eukprot:6223315-Alexandrium_andersonii.AAC.1
MRCRASTHQCLSIYPWCWHPCSAALFHSATPTTTIACSRDASEHSCTGTSGEPPGVDPLARRDGRGAGRL